MVVTLTLPLKLNLPVPLTPTLTLCRLNLASYVSTWMEDAADEIFSFAKNVNLADSVQYPSSALMERRRGTVALPSLSNIVLYLAQPVPEHITSVTLAWQAEDLQLFAL